LRKRQSLRFARVAETTAGIATASSSSEVRRDCAAMRTPPRQHGGGPMACACAIAHEVAGMRGRPREGNPEAMSKSEGARAPKRCVLIFRAAFRRPRAASPGRGCGHIRERAFGPTGHSSAGLTSFGDLWRLRSLNSDVSLRAPFATGCRAFHCWRRTASLRLAQDLRRAVPRDDIANGTTPPHLDTTPRPASDAQACRVPRGQGCAQYTNARKSGD
jgi:hypothetical protein